jgi:hypothetical protein
VNVSVSFSSAAQVHTRPDKCTTVMTLLTLCYEDRNGVARQSRCRRETERGGGGHITTLTALQTWHFSEVLKRDVTRREAEVPSVCLLQLAVANHGTRH